MGGRACHSGVAGCPQGSASGDVGVDKSELGLLLAFGPSTASQRLV